MNAYNLHPSNLYINFVLRAVLGQLREADTLMRMYRSEIRSMARALRKQYPVKSKPLHRGLLIDGDFDATGREFVSWSESADVASWFADPRSMMNEYVMHDRPRSVGYMLTLRETSTPSVLFHWSWARLADLPSLARRHPEMGREGARQIEWSLGTQHEVITEPPIEWPELRPFISNEPSLDHKFAPPWLTAQGV